MAQGWRLTEDLASGDGGLAAGQSRGICRDFCWTQMVPWDFIKSYKGFYTVVGEALGQGLSRLSRRLLSMPAKRALSKGSLSDLGVFLGRSWSGLEPVLVWSWSGPAAATCLGHARIIQNYVYIYIYTHV